MPRIVLTAASYTAPSLAANAQRCVNLYPEANPADAPAPMTFYGTPGKKLWSTVPGDGGIRCLFQSSRGILFAVRGNTLYQYGGAGTGTGWNLLAVMSTNFGPVIAAENTLSVVFVDGTAVAPTVDLLTLQVGMMSGPGWYGADFAYYIDGFIAFNRPNTQQFYITGALNLVVDPLDFASAEAVSDILISMISDRRELWLFGTKSVEVFSNSGGIFPLERINGSIMDVGCAAKHSPARLDNSVIWLGSDNRGDCTVWRATGYQPQRISTNALENEFRRYARIDDAQAFTYQQNGHLFYVLTFPDARKTWAYDVSTGQWAERAHRTDNNVMQRDIANCHVLYGRSHLVGDFRNGNVYELDLDTYTDNGDAIGRVKSFQHITRDNLRQFFSQLTLDMEAGVGNDGEIDPKVSLRWSDDGGHVWSATLTASIGKIGEYMKKPHFNRLGMGRDRIFEVSTAAKAKIVLQGAFVKLGVGTS